MRHLAAAFVLLCPSIAFSAEIPDAKFYRDAARRYGGGVDGKST
jgi:hypothetical protein